MCIRGLTGDVLTFQKLFVSSQLIKKIFLSWQLSEHILNRNWYDNVGVFGLGGIDLLLCWNAAAVGYCCCCRLLLLVQNKYRNSPLPIHTAIRCCEYLRQTVVVQIAYIITSGRSIQVELGKVEGFRGALKACCKILQWMLERCLNIKQQAHWLHMQHEPISLCQVV